MYLYRLKIEWDYKKNPSPHERFAIFPFINIQPYTSVKSITVTNGHNGQTGKGRGGSLLKLLTLLIKILCLILQCFILI
jgi:hypothetical protein